MRWLLLLLPLALAATPAAAQRHDLPVPLDKGWKHAATGIVLTATLAGLPRTTLADYGNAERDIAAEFAKPERATIATLYIFRPAFMSVPMWFDRAQTALEVRDIYHGAIPVDPQPIAFARPGASVAAGLRQTYRPAQGPYTATSLAVVPSGEWLVVVRLSSTVLDPAAAMAKVSDILAAIRWPSVTETAPIAVPVQACSKSLSYKTAKLKKPDMMQALLGGTIALAALKDDKKSTASTKPVLWCRDPIKPALEYGVYRAESDDVYTLAVADSSRVANVYKSFELPGEPSTGGYAVTYQDLDGSIATFPSFDALPRPEQVLRLVLGSQPIARTAGSGDKQNINIGVPK